MIKKEKKTLIIDKVVSLLYKHKVIYLISISNMNVAEINILRKMCFDKKIIFFVIKNTLLKRSFDIIDKNKYYDFYSLLHNNTALMISDNDNLPAKVITTYKNNIGSFKYPIFKGAYVQDTFYIGVDKFNYLLSIKTKEELIIDIINSLRNLFNNMLFSVTSCNNFFGLFFQKNVLKK